MSSCQHQNIRFSQFLIYKKIKIHIFCPIYNRESFVLWWTWIVTGETHPHEATAMDREMTGKMQAQKVALWIYIGWSVLLCLCVCLSTCQVQFIHITQLGCENLSPYHTCCWSYGNTKPLNKKWDNNCKYFCCLGPLLIFFFFPLFVCAASEKQGGKKIEAFLNVSPQKGFFTFNY